MRGPDSGVSSREGLPRWPGEVSLGCAATSPVGFTASRPGPDQDVAPSVDVEVGVNVGVGVADALTVAVAVASPTMISR